MPLPFNPARPYWTKEELDTLQHLVTEGTIRDAVKQLKRSNVAIYRKARSLNLRFRHLYMGRYGRTTKKWTSREIWRFMGLIERGYSLMDIAGCLHRPYNSVKSVAAKHNIKSRGAGVLTFTQAGKILGVHRTTVTTYFKKVCSHHKKQRLKDRDIIKIAEAILKVPNSQCKTSARRLRAIIQGDLHNGYIY